MTKAGFKSEGTLGSKNWFALKANELLYLLLFAFFFF